MSFDLGGFFGSIIGVVGAYLIAKWQFENSNKATINLEKEMFIRTRTIKNIDEIILESKNISKFIEKTYLFNLSLSNYPQSKQNIKNNIAKADEELFNLLDVFLLSESLFLGYDDKDCYVLNSLEIKDKFTNIEFLKCEINLYIINLLNEKEPIEILKDTEIKNKLKKLNLEIEKMNYTFNTYKIYNVLRMKKNDLSKKEIEKILEN